MNKNTIVTDTWSEEASRRLYLENWPEEPASAERKESGVQCGGCSFFAPFNSDWGLCCHAGSRHHLETVFEHFYCPAHQDEGWGPHSFSSNPEFFCRCGGRSSEEWDKVLALFENPGRVSEESPSEEPPAPETPPLTAQGE